MCDKELFGRRAVVEVVTSVEMSFFERMTGSWTKRDQEDMSLTNIEGQGSGSGNQETGWQRDLHGRV